MNNNNPQQPSLLERSCKTPEEFAAAKAQIKQGKWLDKQKCARHASKMYGTKSVPNEALQSEIDGIKDSITATKAETQNGFEQVEKEISGVSDHFLDQLTKVFQYLLKRINDNGPKK